MKTNEKSEGLEQICSSAKYWQVGVILWDFYRKPILAQASSLSLAVATSNSKGRTRQTNYSSL